MGVARRTSSSRTRGFTLIELILALFLTAIAAVAISSVLSYGFHAAKDAELKIEPSRTASLALSMIENDFQNAFVPNANYTAYGVAPFAGPFEGVQSTDSRGREDDNVDFFTTADSPLHVDANGELKEVYITVVQNVSTGEYDLVRRTTRNQLAPTQPQPDEEIICRNVASFTLQYFDGSQWDTSWDSTAEDNTLPAAVQVTLQLERPTGASNGATRLINYTRTWLIPASTAATDTNVNGSL